VQIRNAINAPKDRPGRPRTTPQPAIKNLFVPAVRQLQITTNATVLPQGETPIPDSIFHNLINPGTFRLPGQVPQLHNALAMLISSIIKFDAEQERRVSTALYAWAKSGKKGPSPEVPVSQMAKVENMVAELLGFECKVSPPNPNSPSPFKFTKGAASFGVEGLSDGQKQTLLFGVLLLTSATDNFICLVDEPEAHLNEARAIEFWEKIERQFPKAVFLYATHSVAFATRPTIDRQFLISMDGAITPIERDQAISAPIVRTIVGARVQLLRNTGSPIFCEDNLSKMILEDIFEDQDVDIVPLNNCQSVQAAVNGESLWGTIRTEGANFCGVIDRDTRDDDEVLALEGRGIFCFPLYEAESLLTDVDIARWMLTTSSGRSVTQDEYVPLLVEAAKRSHKKTIDLIGKYLAEKSKPVIFAKLSSDQTALEDVEISGSAETLEAAFRARQGALADAIVSLDVAKIPLLFKGKDLYARVAELAKELVPGGLTHDPTIKYNEVRNHQNFKALMTSLSWVKQFKAKILSRLSQVR
jgi:hypothetical protein